MKVSCQFHVLAAVPLLKEPQYPSKLISNFKCDPYEEKIDLKFLAYLVDKR